MALFAQFTRALDISGDAGSEIARHWADKFEKCIYSYHKGHPVLYSTRIDKSIVLHVYGYKGKCTCVFLRLDATRVKLFIFNYNKKNEILSFEGSSCSNYFQSWRPPENFEIDFCNYPGDVENAELFDYKYGAAASFSMSREWNGLTKNVCMLVTPLVTCLLRASPGPECMFFPVFKGVTLENDTLLLCLNPRETTDFLMAEKKNKSENSRWWNLAEEFPKPATDFSIDFRRWAGTFTRVSSKHQATEILASPERRKFRYKHLKDTNWAENCVVYLWWKEAIFNHVTTEPFLNKP